MHVDRNRHHHPGIRYPRHRSHVRRGFAAGLLLLIASVGGVVLAADFDEKLKAPLMKDAGTLRTQAQSFSARFGELKGAGSEQLITNGSLAGERFDLAWQIQQAIDTHRPLGDLSAIGLVSRDDGTYEINLNAFPQWNRLDQSCVAVLPQLNWDTFARQLVNRGMAPNETAKLRQYISTHDARAAAGARTLPISLSFSRLIRKYDKVKRPVPDSVVLSYVYQRARADAEATREWTEGLLKSVEAQSARVLLSTLGEGKASSIWAPSDQAAGIVEILESVRLPNFEELATAQSRGEAP